MNLELHKSFAASFEKLHKRKKELKVSSCMGIFFDRFDILLDKGVAETKIISKKFSIEMMRTENKFNLVLYMKFGEDGAMKNVCIGYVEAGETVFTWEYYKNRMGEGFVYL